MGQSKKDLRTQQKKKDAEMGIDRTAHATPMHMPLHSIWTKCNRPYAKVGGRKL